MSAGCGPHGYREPCSECAFEAMEPSPEERVYIEEERKRHRNWADTAYKPAAFNAAQYLRWKRHWDISVPEATSRPKS